MRSPGQRVMPPEEPRDPEVGLDRDSGDGFSRQQLLEISGCLGESLPQRDRWPQIKQFLRFADVWPVLFGIIRGKRAVNNFRRGASDVDDDLRQLTNREFCWVPKVYRSNDFVAGFHYADQVLYQIIDVAERPALHAVTVDGGVVVSQRQIRYDAVVVGVHARAVCIEDLRHFDAKLVLTVIVEEQHFGTALALVVTGARPNRVHVAPIVFRLRVNGGIAVYLGGGGLQDPGLHALGEAQHVYGAVNAGLGRLHRVELVMNRGRRAGEVINVVDLDVERKADIMSNELKPGIRHDVVHVLPRCRDEVVQAEDLIPAGQQSLAQMGAYESGSSDDKDSAVAEHLFASSH